MNLEARPRSWLVWLALWIVYIVWGSTYLAIRVTVETMPPFLSAGVRFVLAGAAFYLVLRVRRGAAHVRITRRELGATAIVGAALLLGGNGLVSVAEQDVPSALAALIIASVPLWVIVLRSIFDGGVPRTTAAGVAAGFAGVAILLLPGERPDGASLAGMLLLVVASLSWATGSFFSPRLPLPRDPFVSTAYQMLAGGAILIAAGLATGEGAALDPGRFSGASIAALAYLVVFGSWFAFTAYTWLLQNAPISKVATYAYVNPVIAIVLGWLVLSEDITTIVLAGAGIIVGSVAFTVSRETQARARRDAAEVTPGPAAAALEPSEA